MKTQILTPTKENISLAAAEIKAGGIVAFPTETVYGLGADALNKSAVEKIYFAKGRAQDNPLIIHLASIEQIGEVAYLDHRADRLIKKFMPGALTLVLLKKPHVPMEVTGGLDTVAIRIPSNQTAIDFIKACGTPIAAPSANTSGYPSPTKAGHVYDDLDSKLRYILDGGDCEIGLESTIIDFSGPKIRVLRLGGIPIEELAELIGQIDMLDSADKPLAPGMKYRHYAPKARVYLCQHNDDSGVILQYNKLTADNKKVVVILNHKIEEIENAVIMKDTQDYAHRLFYQLRWADQQKADAIICQKAHPYGLGKAINNRLEKALNGL